MAFRYGFYPSVDGDRNYSEDDIGGIFDGIINDGVYANIGNHFKVVPYYKTNQTTVKVAIQTGRAWFDHTFAEIHDSPLILDMGKSPVYTSYSIFLVVNKIKRESYFEGLPIPYVAASNDNIKYHRIAVISSLNGSAITPSGLTQSMITQKVGSEECPYVTAALQTLTTEELINGWQAEFDAFMNGSNTTFNNKVTGWTNNFNTFINTSTTTFNSKIATWTSSFNASLAEFTSVFNTFINQSKSKWNTDFANWQSEFNTFMKQARELLTDEVTEKFDAWVAEKWPNYMAQYKEEFESQFSTLPLKSFVLDENGLEVVDENGSPITAMNRILII